MVTGLRERKIFNALRSSKKSILLLGPRQTGKSTLMKLLNPELTVNMAKESTYLAFARNPDELLQRIDSTQPRTVFIDEVQRLPSLLNTIQTVIDDGKPKIQFYLTGSSARKLKRGNANLLPGRIHTYYLGPLTSAELNYKINTRLALSIGTLPGIYLEADAKDRMKTLRSYAATYLKEEIQAEALTKNLEGFARFLMVTAAVATQFLDISKLASDAQITRQSALRFFGLLEETLIVSRCDSFAKSDRKRLIQHPRFFLFDNGVLNGLLGNFTVSADRIGALFENLLFNQISQSALSNDLDIRISSYRTEHGAEVDFIVETPSETWAIEAKATANIGQSDLSGLKNFANYFGKPHRSVVMHMGDAAKKIGGIDVLPWQMALKEIFP